MEHNHMLVPTSDRETLETVHAPPSARPPSTIMPFSPPAYSLKPDANLTTTTIRFSDIPTTELPPPLAQPIRSDHEVKLPSLSSITGGHGIPRGDMVMNAPPNHWPSHNPIPYHISPHQPLPSIDSPARMDLDTSSNSAISAASVTSAGSPDRFDGRASSVSLDDPDVRLAAEALGDLRADFISSPPNTNSSLPLSPPTSHNFPQNNQLSNRPPRPEPLLSLLTTSHPLLASTIEGATSAYGGAKNYSPRFRSGAEYVEGYITPIANTVGSVSRVTGVEGGVRWFLGAGRRAPSSSSDIETGNGKKRRKNDNAGPISNKRLEGEGMKQIMGLQSPSEADLQQEIFSPTSKAGSRRMSVASTVDTLPAYDEMRSPAYTETIDGQNSPRQSTPANNRAWQSRLIMSTSGLSVAMSEESLRSLKYCLRWLRWANEHITHITGSLKTTLEQYEQSDEQGQIEISEKTQMDGSQAENGQGPSRTDLAVRITTLKGDVLKTLKDVIETVSKYAGGALPENARILVRRHLTSLPQRFRVATISDRNPNSNQDSESTLREGAQKVLVLAKEGLDMVAQVSGVLDGTIVSAEEWCDRMGKRRKDQDEKPVLPQTETNGDVKMAQ